MLAFSFPVLWYTYPEVPGAWVWVCHSCFVLLLWLQVSSSAAADGLSSEVSPNWKSPLEWNPFWPMRETRSFVEHMSIQQTPIKQVKSYFLPKLDSSSVCSVLYNFLVGTVQVTFPQLYVEIISIISCPLLPRGADVVAGQAVERSMISFLCWYFAVRRKLCLI